MLVWLNGEMVNADQARVLAHDHGFIVGDGVFETLLARDGVILARRLHLTRLERSAAGLGLHVPREVESALDTVLTAGATVGDWRLRITLTSGAGPLGSDRGAGPATLMVSATPATPWPATTEALLSSWQRNPASPIVGLKTTSYAENVVALAAAKRVGASEALFLGPDGSLCEGSGTNLLVNLDGSWFTPPATTGLLLGTTRLRLISWFDVEIRTIGVADLMAAQAVALTSATRGVHPVTRVHRAEQIYSFDSEQAFALADVYWQRVMREPDPQLEWQVR